MITAGNYDKAQIFSSNAGKVGYFYLLKQILYLTDIKENGQCYRLEVHGCMFDTLMVIYGLKLNLINISLKTIVLEEGVLCPLLKGHKVQRQ